MTRFLLQRLLYMVALVLIASTTAYLLAATQLRPRSRYEERQQPPPPEAVDSLLSAINMNDKDPLLERFGRWAGGLVRGDFGRTVDNTSVSEEIWRRMWVSIRLLLAGAVLGTLLGVAAGATAAVKQYRPPDVMVGAASFLIMSMPIVVLAVLLKNGAIGLNNLLGLTGDNALLLTTGEITPGVDSWSWAGIKDRLQHLIVPTTVLMLASAAFYGRYQRNAMLDVLGSDYIRTAQAKGLRRSRALIAHGLRTALIPIATFFSYQFALLFVGATFTEKIFGWHGMGAYFVDSVTKNDVNSVAAVTFLVAILVLVAGFLSDVAYAALDPRVRR